MDTIWHDIYEPASTSEAFPHSSIWRHWARRAGETLYEVALQSSHETGNLHGYAITALRRVEAEEIVTVLRALGEHVIRII